MPFEITIGDTERQFIIDNPNLKSNVMQKLINVSTTHINRIKHEVHGKVMWFHDGNKYPYLNKGKEGYRIKYAGNLILRTKCVKVAIEVIDNMISNIENDYFTPVEYENKGLIPVMFKLPPVYEIARSGDFSERYRKSQRDVIQKRARY